MEPVVFPSSFALQVILATHCGLGAHATPTDDDGLLSNTALRHDFPEKNWGFSMYKNLVSRTFWGGSGIGDCLHSPEAHGCIVSTPAVPVLYGLCAKFVSVGETCPTVSYSIVAVWLHRHSEGRSAAQMLPLGVSSKYG